MFKITNTPSKATKQFDVDKEPHSFTDTQGIITTTGNDIPGYRIVKVLGTVYGLR